MLKIVYSDTNNKHIDHYEIEDPVDLRGNTVEKVFEMIAHGLFIRVTDLSNPKQVRLTSIVQGICKLDKNDHLTFSILTFSSDQSFQTSDVGIVSETGVIEAPTEPNESGKG